MEYLKLQYAVADDKTLHELVLNAAGHRWNDRTIVLAIVKHEFPEMRDESMNSPEWNPERVLERFKIADLRFAFLRHDKGEFQTEPLAQFRIRKRRSDACSR